jgi:hypothetical protein
VTAAVARVGEPAGGGGAAPAWTLSPQARVRWRAVRDGLSIVGLVAIPLIVWLNRNVDSILGFDAYATWAIDLDRLYSGVYLDLGTFRYTPVYAEVFAWAGRLPWELFLGLWLAAIVVIIHRWTGRWTLAAIAVPMVALELYHGNIHVFMAAAMVYGFRWPALWAFPLLAKVTPGIAVVWFAGRREWRKLAIALCVTAVIAVASFVLAPNLWADFVAVNRAGIEWTPETPLPVDVAFMYRAPVALALAFYGGRRDWRWTVPIAGMIALPIIWWHGYAMLLGVIPLLRDDIGRGTVVPPIAVMRRIGLQPTEGVATA